MLRQKVNIKRLRIGLLIAVNISIPPSVLIFLMFCLHCEIVTLII